MNFNSDADNTDNCTMFMLKPSPRVGPGNSVSVLQGHSGVGWELN